MLLSESAFKGFTFVGVLTEMTEGVFNAITNRRIKRGKILDRLRCKANLSHCASLKTCLNDLNFPAFASFNP